MPKQLQVISGPDKGRVFALTGDFLLGRSRQTQSQLTDRKVSRVHCQVEIDGDQMVVTDLDSQSGTYVNGKRITEHVLQRGDVIQIGATQLSYTIEAVDLAEHPTVVTDKPAVLKPETLPVGRLHELSGTMLSHFDIGEVIAKGTGGVVFQARDLKDDSTVAFKVLDPNFSKQEEQKRRFIRAMKTMLPLRHPNLVAVYSAGKTGPYCWISMEYVEGESLAQVIKRIGTAGMLDWRYALRVAVHIGRGLAFAHAHRIIHRNLGPSNILIRKSDSRAKLGDLMLAKALEGVHVERITRPGDVVGNAHYMAPEQVDGRPLDERSDLFSLGSTIYAVLTGRTPFEGSTLVEIIKNVQSATPVKPTKYQPSISAGFEEIVLKLLAKRPEERYRSAKELLTDLDRVVRSEPQLPTDFYKEAEPEPVPGAKAVERTETVVEALPAAAIRQKTRVEKAPAKPVVRTDTVVEAFSPSHVESQDRAEESSTATPRGQVHWMWLVGTGVVALAAIAALIVVLLTRR